MTDLDKTLELNFSRDINGKKKKKEKKEKKKKKEKNCHRLMNVTKILYNKERLYSLSKIEEGVSLEVSREDSHHYCRKQQGLLINGNSTSNNSLSSDQDEEWAPGWSKGRQNAPVLWSSRNCVSNGH